ncbi:heme-binding domain-containing protein [Actinomarinicola tropica]|uniref:Cytochrome C n=1 Tax=Actinomarinicola tropica TaxID=2789776 RepID=A0A5Q2RK57_9ACTN|nr:heme-binding domain-containing protein [Actinomarinicola tropica]QGG94437.1 cytochrome C [Actinomarinicola tropica]
MRRILVRSALGALVVFLAIQLVPYGWEKPNPPVVAEPTWPSARAEELARSACYDCHSNETDWPAYSYVAPMSWLVRRDVESGRDELNFSEWDGDGDDAAETVAEGSMPPAQYSLLHPGARLSDAERQELEAALLAIDD